MLLSKIEIKNFRSISNLTLETPGYDCRVLVGLNESGKSNVLKALALLSPDFQPKIQDKRIERPTDDIIDSAYVRFVFSLSDEEIEDVYTEVVDSFHEESLGNPLFTDGRDVFTLREFLEAKNEAVLVADILEEKKTFKYWSLGNNWALLPGWQTLSPGTESMGIELSGKESTVSSGQFFFLETTVGLGETSIIMRAALSKVYEKIGQAILSIAKSNAPQCIYWEYKEANILPSSINVNVFVQDPDMCAPLRSMFELAGLADEAIGGAIASARAQPPHIYANLLQRVALAATRHIRQVWKEYAGISIVLNKNGDFIEPVVTENELALDFANRSDGFKRFVSFLLLISAKVRAATIANTLVLVDEPEIALHPSGAKNLRDELIRVGGNNHVFYSTHSIFLIDRDKIDRHLIVKKVDEVTSCKRAEKSIVQDEEVIFNAIGFSIFEIIKGKNLIFEGWRDKQLFQVALRRNNESTVSKLGYTHAEGVKDIKHLARLMELGSRDCLIISDADNVAKQHKKTFENDRGYGRWVTYADIPNLPKGYITAEDFLEDTYILAMAKKLKEVYSHLRELTNHDLGATGQKLASLDKWIAESTSSAQHGVIVSTVKDLLFGADLTHDAIVPDYEHVLTFATQGLG